MFFNNKKRLFPLIFFVSFMFAQPPPKFLLTKTIDINNGLPSNEVYWIKKDLKGYLWICTRKGICKYDGRQIKVFNIRSGLPSNDIFDAEVDGKNRIWLSLKSTVIYYIENDKVIKYKKIPENEVLSALLPLSVYKQNIIFAGRYSTFMIDKNTTEAKKIYSSTDLYPYQKFIGFINNNFFFIKNKDKLYSPNNVLIKNIDTKKEKVIVLSENLGNNIYAKSNQIKEIYFQNDQNRIFKLKENYTISEYKVLSQNQYLIRNNNKLFIQNENEILNEKNIYFKQQNCNSIIENEDKMYVCTQGEGIKIFEPVNAKPKLKTKSIRNLIYIDQNRMIVNDLGGDIYDICNNHIEKFKTKTTILCMARVSNDLILLNDLKFISLKKHSIVNFKDVIKKIKTYSVSREKYIFQNYYENGLNYSKDFYKFNSTINFWSSKIKINNPKKNEIIAYFRVKPLLISIPYAVATNSDSLIYTGSAEGLYFFNYNKPESNYKKIIHPHPSVNSFINDLYFDKKNNIYIASDGYGLTVYNIKNKTLNEIKELKNTYVSQVKHDTVYNRTICTSNLGISVIENYNHEKNTYKYKLINPKPNGKSLETKCFDIWKNKLAVGTNNGIIEYNLDSIETKTSPDFNIYINNITTNFNKKYNANKYNLFGYQENSITLNFSYINWKNIDDSKLKYWIKGNIDTFFSDKSDVLLTNLAPQKYTIQYTACIFNNCDKKIRQFHFEIMPPWYKTIWFYVTVSLLLTATSAMIFYLRFRNKINMLNNQNQLNQLQLNAVKNQLNPHFLFNALQSIQLFILKGNQLEASVFLSEFSTLVRRFLDYSNTDFITLKQELDIIFKYVNIEKLRFENKFKYKVFVDKKIDQNGIKLPSLLLQPIVENAINHGLKYKENNGILCIIIRYNESKNLEIIIEDNGIGRKASSEIKAKLLLKHESKGNKLTSDKIDLYNKIYKNMITIQYIDLIENKIPKGTKVIIKINFNH